MHSFVRACGALLLLAPFAAAAQGPGVKIAYVDSRFILANAPATPVAQAALQREVVAMEAQVKRMSDSLDALTTAFNKEQATLSGDKRDARLKAIGDRQGEYQQRYQALQQQAQDREAELMQPVLDQIKLVLEDLRAEGGYTMIFDVAQSGAIVAVDKNLNLSDRVLARLRTMPLPAIAERGGEAAKADPKAAKTPPGAPVSAPAGVGRPGAVPPAAAKRPDSTSKADSAAKKADSSKVRPKVDTIIRPPLGR